MVRTWFFFGENISNAGFSPEICNQHFILGILSSG